MMMMMMIEIFNLEENNLTIKNINVTKHFGTYKKQIMVK
jgi:hypothetical protein